MAAEQIKSATITNLDSSPIQQATSAQGAGGRLVIQDDFVPAAATPLQSTKSVYRILRIPTGAIPKSLFIATTVALDSGTHALVFDLNIAWADDSRYLPNSIAVPAAGEATIPTTANDGSTTTTVSAYSSPNIMFGTINNVSASVAYTSGELIANGSQTNYPVSVLTQQPLWQTLGFVDGRGNPADPGGYFDLLAYVSTAAGTGAAGKLYARMLYGI